MAQPLVAVDPGVGQRRVLVAAEGEHSLVHVGAVENVERNQQMKIIDAQAGDRLEQAGFELRNDVFERVLAEVGEVHERRDAGREFDQFLLD